MSKTIATLCSGGGLVEAGAVMAGVEPIWGLEYDPEVGELHRLNFPDCQLIEGDLTSFEGERYLEVPDILHVSPPCQNFSWASDRSESIEDEKIAGAVSNWILVATPPIFTLENVPDYARSESWARISNTLYRAGYMINSGMVSMEKWGVPQSRRRFIAIATHKRFCPYIYPDYERVTIQDAIEDLIPSLAKSSLTKTQLSKMLKSDRDYIESGGMAVIKRVGIRAGTTVSRGNDFCHTLLAGIGTDGKGSSRKSFLDIVYQGQIYSASTRVVARLMSVPDDYKFGKVLTKTVVKALGNGVPPVFYKHLLEQII